jgi:hypothetical protein
MAILTLRFFASIIHEGHISVSRNMRMSGFILLMAFFTRGKKSMGEYITGHHCKQLQGKGPSMFSAGGEYDRGACKDL